MTLFVDSDILLDAILLRSPHDQFAAQLLSLTDQKGYTLCISAHSLLNVHYFTHKEAGKTAALKSVGLLEEKLKVLATGRQVIRQALSSDFKDVEDAVQHSLAIEAKCQIIITRNLKDYKKSSIPVMTAEQYLKSL